MADIFSNDTGSPYQKFKQIANVRNIQRLWNHATLIAINERARKFLQAAKLAIKHVLKQAKTDDKTGIKIK